MKKLVTFESINQERGNDIANRFRKKEYKVSRAEIILTNKCQLKCVYCQKYIAEEAYESKINPSIMKEMIETCLLSGCNFIHFTGGEATLCSELVEYVEMCSSHNSKVTLSTNGTSSTKIYNTLVKSGVNSFHISMDTNDKNIFDKQVGVEGSFEKVIKTINHITMLRDEGGYDTKLVINTCITPTTFHKLPEILEFILSLKPNDVKLIPIAQLKDQWIQLSDTYEKIIKSQLLNLIPTKKNTTDFNMLVARINNLVKQSFRGYNNKREVPPCYLSVDERTIDPQGNYYGCYINYREGAAPVGSIKTDSFELQFEKLRAEMKMFTNSEICQRFCADITVLCNKYIDEKIEKVLNG